MHEQNWTDESLSKVRQFAEGLFRERLEAVILFGSYARGDYDAESDIDIMILVDMDALALAPFKYQFARFGTDLDLKYGVFHSFVLQDKATFDYWKDTIPFYKNVVQGGVPVNV
ncbi:MAG: nucleotidyltransferase domain-containing protein [Synergistaceae bacterium]|jgi:predicted nucleotidyltransferase|nr:nucleotidyltransferase domain-containing protein [Synergistaceae bacterium]